MTALIAAIPSPPFQDLVIGPLNFRMYGVAIALGVVAAVSIGRRRWAARGGDPEDITTLAIIVVPFGLIGARLYHVITDFGERYSGDRWTDAFKIWEGGLGIPGGIALGAVAGVVACKRMKMDWRYVADAAAPAIPVAQAIGRLGNWFNQELYGRATTLPWGLEIDVPPPEYPPQTLFHPTFLYEGLWNLALAGLIVVGGRRVVLKPGRWLAVYLVGYGLGRLWVESLRIDFASTILGLRVNTWVSGLVVIGGLLWLFWRGSPVDAESTAVLRAGGDPLANVVEPRPVDGADRDLDSGDRQEDASSDAVADEDAAGKDSADEADEAAAGEVPDEAPAAPQGVGRRTDDPGSSEGVPG